MIMMKRFAIALAAVATILGGGYAFSQNANQTNQIILTMLGTELIQVQSAVNNTAAIAYTTVASLRDGRGYVYNAPLTGFSLTVSPTQSAVSLNPAGTIAAGTVVFPATLVDGKMVSIFTSATITALTLSTTNSATFTPSAVTTLAAGTSVAYVYNKAGNVWYRFQ
jgi:hypothetical protein